MHIQSIETLHCRRHQSAAYASGGIQGCRDSTYNSFTLAVLSFWSCLALHCKAATEHTSMATAITNWQLKIIVHPSEGFMSKDAFDTKFTKFSSMNSWLTVVKGRLKITNDADLGLFEGDGVQLSVDAFVASATEYTRTGHRCLASDSADYDDNANKAVVNVNVRLLAGVPGANISPVSSERIIPSFVNAQRQVVCHTFATKCKLYITMPDIRITSGPMCYAGRDPGGGIMF